VRLRQLAPEVWVGISPVWQTTHTICGARGALIIDGPVRDAELEALAAWARPAALIATHADWNHLLAPLAFPAAHLLAGRATIDRCRADRRAIAAELAAWDTGHQDAPRLVPDWGAAAALEAPGTVASPVGPMTVVATPGHTPDGIALLLTEPGILVAGDYLSPREIALLETDTAVAEYLASLDRLEALVAKARCVVPGHGWPVSAARARTLLHEDRRYVEALGRGERPRLPRGASDPAQQRAHRANLRAASGR
jgi:glyoxylase-like metal-dependent hydrolase (beta-lactamase superfamily II)